MARPSMSVNAQDMPDAAPYRVRAFNTAVASENKIHDDTVARRYGFSGGLVPGVEVYAYMTHPCLLVYHKETLFLFQLE